MLNYSLYIVEDNGTFYFDVDEYNSKSDIKVESGDVIKFTYEGKKYMGKVLNLSGKKNDIYILKILN
jgi:hypothetical protein